MSNENNGNDEKGLRHRILEAARHLLVQEGYQGLSMRRIGKMGGFSATTIYLYFENKDALFHALIDEGFGYLQERLEEATEPLDDDPVGQLKAICRSFVDFGLEHPEYYEIMFMLHPEHVERYPPEKYRRAHSNIHYMIEALEGGKEAGDLVVEDPRVTASTIWASLHGIVSLLIAHRVDADIDRDVFIDTALRQTIAGVSAGGAGGDA